MSLSFPKRRGEDKSDQTAIGRLLTFTDLMAVLLCFFIMLYATRDPIQARTHSFPITPIAPIVAQDFPHPAAGSKTPALSRPMRGLDLNYIAALLRQAQGNTDEFAAMDVATYDYAIVVTLKNSDPFLLRAVLDKVASYRRTVEVYATDALLTPFLQKPPASVTRYFPSAMHQNPVIVIQ